MITNIFISALCQAIFESCGQALLIYVVLQLAMQFFPALSSRYKYDINYLGLTIITCWFFANLVNICLKNAEAVRYSIPLHNHLLIKSPKLLPTLLQQAEAFISSYAKYITGLYMIGLLLQGFKLLGGFVHIHHIRQQKNLSADSFWTTKAELLSQKLKIVKKVALYFSSRVDVPLTIGYLKPMVIFPVALLNNLDTEQVEAILLHELAHIKRHDYLLNIIQCVMETLLCFNPFVWLISKTIRQEREYCCDDMVMDEEYNNFNYSKALFIIAQQNNRNYALAMASAGKNKYPLLNRIKRLNTMKTNDSLSKTHLLVIISVAAIGGLLAWGIPQYSLAKAPVHHKSIIIAANLKKHGVVETKISFTANAVPPAKALNDTSSNAATLVDTSKNHVQKFRIVITDDKGNKKEYNSVKELPDSDKEEFAKQNPGYVPVQFDFNDSLKVEKWKNFQMDPAIKAQVLAMKIDAEKMSKRFRNNLQWNKQVILMKIQAEKISKEANSPEWKKQVADMQLQAKKMAEQFNSTEWQKQVEDMKIQAEQMSKQINSPEFRKQMLDMKKQAEKMSRQFLNSPQYKKQIQDIRTESDQISRQFNSPEWKKQMDEMQDKIKKEAEQNIKDAEADSVKVSKDAKPL